jgi:hypothetical protein
MWCQRQLNVLEADNIMVKTRRYLRPRKHQAEQEFQHLLEEATVLVEALVLQQAGSNPEKFKIFDIRKVSIDNLNEVLITIKNLVKNKLHFLDGFFDDLKEECIEKIQESHEFTRLITHLLQRNLISDNNDISLYLSPYIEDWDLLTAGVQSLIINHIVKSINRDIKRTEISEKIAQKFS